MINLLQFFNRGGRSQKGYPNWFYTKVTFLIPHCNLRVGGNSNSYSSCVKLRNLRTENKMQISLRNLPENSDYTIFASLWCTISPCLERKCLAQDKTPHLLNSGRSVIIELLLKFARPFISNHHRGTKNWRNSDELSVHFKKKNGAKTPFKIGEKLFEIIFR